MSGPNHHEEMEAHYAAGMQRQEEQFLIDDAMVEAKAKVAEEVEREGYPPAAEVLVAIGVRAGVQAARSRLSATNRDADRVARLINPAAFRLGNPDYFGPDIDVAWHSAAQRVALKVAQQILDTIGGRACALALPASAIEGGTEP